MSVIEVEDLSRRYGNLIAVQGVSFAVEPGEIFGFLGPNGAGKTSTIHMLCTLLKPTSGRASVGGHDVVQDRASVRRSIGLVFQESSLDEQLTARENLRFHAMLYGLSRSEFRRRAETLLELVELTDRADSLVETFSGGMKRRLEVARGLVHRPKVLFLDEPTLGLDPQTRRLIWEHLRRLRESEGVTVFMTTHYMDEAETCDRVAVIDHGQIVAIDTPKALKDQVGGDVVAAFTSDNETALAKLEAVDHLQPRLGPDQQVILEVEGGEAFVPKLVSILSSGPDPVDVQSISLRRPTLEDVFVKLTGRAIRDPGEGSEPIPPRRRRH